MSVAIQEMPGVVIDTTRFGTIEVEADRMIAVQGGLLGFEQEEAFCLLEHAPGSPFRWLQAVNNPTLAFVVVNPFDFFLDYDFEVADTEVQHLRAKDSEEIVVLTVVTINDKQVTTNLVGPILVNMRTRTGKQVVLADTRYSTRHSLV